MKEYRTDDIIVHWEAEICSHSAICLKNLPQVFNLDARPWINVNAASAEDIIRLIDLCPSGALRYSLPEGSRVDPALANGPGSMNIKYDGQPVITMKILRNGPILIDGPFTITNTDGNTINREGKTSLCRCGLSNKRPFCDGTHAKKGWKVD
ncbi:MAG: (4Fe-4S)-binding protein [Syntrophomonadaceae bacterium]|nr:(4Fe-4S)-binding protein [Syntrophomonadaceae bacterium]